MANYLTLRFPGGLSKCLTLSYDDAVIQDERLMKLLKEHGIKATYNINTGLYADRDYDDSKTTHRRMTRERAIKLYKDSGYEVAVHTLTHPFLNNLPAGMLTKEIIDDRTNIERDYGVIARGSAYPFGTWNDAVVTALKSCGIVYGRTVWSSHSFDLPDNWLTLRPTCHHADPELPALTERFLGPNMWGNPMLFYLWGHSYEFDFADNWNIIEDFVEKVGGRDDIWYATNIEVYDYVHAFSELIWNSDMTEAFNPTSTEIFLKVRDTDTSIKPGGTAHFPADSK